MEKTSLKNYSISASYNSINQYSLALPYVLFLIHPLLGILSMFALIATNRGIDKHAYYSLYIFISLYFGLINTTRIPESDLLRYKYIFEEAGKYSFLQYMSGYSKEIIYNVFSYISYYVLLGNFKLYLILVTMIQYCLYFISLHKLFKNNYKTVIVFGIAIYFLHTQIFFASVHLLRQMLAASIFMYFYVTKNVDKKLHWWLIPIASLIHSSSLLLFAISFIPTIKNKARFRTFLIVSIIGILVFIFGNQVINFMDSITSGIPYLNYPFARFDYLWRNEFGWYEGSGVSGIRRNLAIFYLLPLLFVYLTNRIEQKFYSIINFIFIYIFVLEVFVSSGLTYMQMRMAFFIYPFLGIVWALFLLTLLRKYGKLVSRALIFLMIMYMGRKFVLSFLYTDFNLASLTEVILNPLIFYIYNIFT